MTHCVGSVICGLHPAPAVVLASHVRQKYCEKCSSVWNRLFLPQKCSVTEFSSRQLSSFFSFLNGCVWLRENILSFITDDLFIKNGYTYKKNKGCGTRLALTALSASHQSSSVWITMNLVCSLFLGPTLSMSILLQFHTQSFYRNAPSRSWRAARAGQPHNPRIDESYRTEPASRLMRRLRGCVRSG